MLIGMMAVIVFLIGIMYSILIMVPFTAAQSNGFLAKCGRTALTSYIVRCSLCLYKAIWHL
jgi:hypothetical protein